MATTEIIARIQKLRALAKDKAATEGEIKAAVNAVAGLMAKHRLSEADVAERALEMVESDDCWPPEPRVTKWRVILLNAIAIPSGVMPGAVTYADGKIGMRLVGRAEDVQTAWSLWGWLEPEAVRLSEALPPWFNRSMRKNWIIGFALGLRQQLEKPPVPAADATRALAVTSSRRGEVEAWLREHATGGMKKIGPSKRDIKYGHVMEKGFEAGKSYHLGKKLGS